MWEGIEKETEEYIEKSLKDDLNDIEGVYLSRKESPKGNFWVCHREGEKAILGMVGVQYLNEKECELRRMSVLRTARRIKIGHLLLSTLLNFAKQQGYQKCILSTLTRMMPGRKLYESNGFVQTKEEQVAPNIRVVYYEKTL